MNVKERESGFIRLFVRGVDGHVDEAWLPSPGQDVPVGQRTATRPARLPRYYMTNHTNTNNHRPYTSKQTDIHINYHCGLYSTNHLKGICIRLTFKTGCVTFYSSTVCFVLPILDLTLTTQLMFPWHLILFLCSKWSKRWQYPR